MKGKFIVLRRVRGGDTDLVATLYGTPGKVTLFVKEGFLNDNKFFGIFEPFNYVVLDYYQRGNVIFPNDIKGVRRFSYLSRDFKRYMIMSKVSLFFIKYVHYYDEDVFRLILNYFLKKPLKKVDITYLKFLLDYLNISGIKPRFLSYRNVKEKFVKIDLSNGEISEKGDYEIEGYILKFLIKLNKGEKVFLYTKKDIKKAEKFLISYIESKS